MTKTLTVRADENLRRALRQRAAVQAKTVSEIVREILEEALLERPIAERAGHLKGQLSVAAKSEDPWRRQLRERNWRS